MYVLVIKEEIGEAQTSVTMLLSTAFADLLSTQCETGVKVTGLRSWVVCITFACHYSIELHPGTG